MLEVGLRSLLVVGLLFTLACSERGRGGGRTGTDRTELGNEDGTNGSTDPDSGVSDNPDIDVSGDGDVGYAAYQRWLAGEQNVPGPLCDCAASFGAYASASECLAEVQASSENACVASFTRTYAEGASLFFDCLTVASSNFTACLRSKSCFEQSDYDNCLNAYNMEGDRCGASLTETEGAAIDACFM